MQEATDYYYNTPCTLVDLIKKFNLTEEQYKQITPKAGDAVPDIILDINTTDNSNTTKPKLVDEDAFKRQATSILGYIQTELTRNPEPKELKMLADSHTALYNAYFGKQDKTEINFNNIQALFSDTNSNTSNSDVIELTSNDTENI